MKKQLLCRIQTEIERKAFIIRYDEQRNIYRGTNELLTTQRHCSNSTSVADVA